MTSGGCHGEIVGAGGGSGRGAGACVTMVGAGSSLDMHNTCGVASVTGVDVDGLWTVVDIG